MKLTKMIYLASPYSHPKKLIRDTRRSKIEYIGAMLQAKYGYAFIHPITTSARLCERSHGNLVGGEFKHWQKIDLTFISRCDEVWVICMEGWQESIGVQAEIEFAKQSKIKVLHSMSEWINTIDPPVDIKVRYVDPETLKFIKCPQREKV